MGIFFSISLKKKKKIRNLKKKIIKMEPDKSEWDFLWKSKSYEKLLILTKEAISKNPKDSEAFRYLAKTLLISKKYPESLEILNKLLILEASDLKKREIQAHILFIKQIIDFENDYNLNFGKAFFSFPKTWYSDRVFQQLKENPPIKDLKDFQKYPDDSVFVLGPDAESIEKFIGSDRNHGVWISLQTKMHPFPNAQAHKDGFLYQHDQNYHFSWWKKHQFLEDAPFSICELKTAIYEIPENCHVVKPHPDCDLYYSYDLIDRETHRILQMSLDTMASTTKDYFIENYQNIIDPNLTVAKQPEADKLNQIRQPYPSSKTTEEPFRWTATDFILEEDKINNRKAKASICSQISNIDPMQNKELHVAVENVFNAALPLLSKLRRPALLLPGKVQTVIKAQRIYLKPGEEYAGVWHHDGKNEEIVAVILYYYRISDKLEGGDLEFMDKRSQIFWLHGDCDPDSFSNEDAKKYVQDNAYCKVPIQNGTLVVFSNYQFIHRVLQMHYPSTEKGDPTAPGGFASRDFLAFFVVDQRSPLMSTTLYQELKSSKIKIEEANEIRKKLFIEQIQPSGTFGVDNGVYSTGNGSVALLGWVKNYIENPEDDKDYVYKGMDRSGLINLKLFNQVPPVSRGISWAVEKNYANILEQGENEDEEKKEE